MHQGNVGVRTLVELDEPYEGEVHVGDITRIAEVRDGEVQRIWVRVVSSGASYKGVVVFPCLSAARYQANDEVEFSKNNTIYSGRITEDGYEAIRANNIKFFGRSKCECCDRPYIESFWQGIREICALMGAKNLRELLHYLFADLCLLAQLYTEYSEQLKRKMLWAHFMRLVGSARETGLVIVPPEPDSRAAESNDHVSLN